MNLDNVKYTWFLVKIKPDEPIDITSGNAETLPDGRLAQLVPLLLRHLRMKKQRAIHKREADK